MYGLAFFFLHTFALCKTMEDAFVLLVLLQTYHNLLSVDRTRVLYQTHEWDTFAPKCVACLCYCLAYY